jgi:hypothetical protein
MSLTNMLDHSAPIFARWNCRTSHLKKAKMIKRLHGDEKPYLFAKTGPWPRGCLSAIASDCINANVRQRSAHIPKTSPGSQVKNPIPATCFKAGKGVFGKHLPMREVSQSTPLFYSTL